MAAMRKRLAAKWARNKNEPEAHDAERKAPTTEALIREIDEACGQCVADKGGVGTWKDKLRKKKGPAIAPAKDHKPAVECDLSPGVKNLPKPVLQAMRKRASKKGDTATAEALNDLISGIKEALCEGYDKDPDKEEMMEFLRRTFGSEFDEFDAEEAIYFFAEQNHSGQSSNLYSVLSTSSYSPGFIRNLQSMLREDGMSAFMYEALESEFGSGPLPGSGSDGERSQQHLGDFV